MILILRSDAAQNTASGGSTAMSTRGFQLGILVLTLCLAIISDVAYGQNDLRNAERVAKEYMTAFYRGDFDKAARLTHPDTLATLKQTFLASLDEARAEGRQREMLKDIGVREDVETLRNMSPHDLYVTLIKSNQKRGNNEALQNMEQTTVEIVSSKLLNANEAAVELKINMPSTDGVENRAGGLLLRRYQKYWRVKTNL